MDKIEIENLTINEKTSVIALLTGEKRKRSNYTHLCRTITKSLDKKVKRKNGVYFTPPSTVEHILSSVLGAHIRNMKMPTVLEPSCGSCQFIKQLRRNFDHIAHITGLEKCTQIYDQIKHLDNHEVKTEILNQDFFTFKSDTKYDLIVGNPPYFQMKKQDVGAEYLPFMDGRPNAYVVFLLKSLKLLKDGGIVCFVLPSTFLSCVSYDKTRRFINRNFTILGIEKCCDMYLETSQRTFVLTVQKKKDDLLTQNDQFTWKVGKNFRLVFGQKEDIAKMKELAKDATIFAEMGFTVRLGHTSWKSKEVFLTDNFDDPRVIYSSDIVDNTLTLGGAQTKAKKHHIDVGKANVAVVRGPFVVVNRGERGGTYNFQHCFVESEEQSSFVVDRQLILIQHENDALCKLAAESLANPKTKQFIDVYLNDSVVSPVDFRHIFPLFCRMD